MEETLLKDELRMVPKMDTLAFRHFPAYAIYIRDNHLVDYIKEQLALSEQVDLPLLRVLKGMTMEELIIMSKTSSAEFLTAAGENRLQQVMQASVQRWVNDELGVMKRDEITAEDLTLASYVRKQALLKFLPAYTTDVIAAIAIVQEIDTYSVEADTANTSVYINLLKERLAEQALFTDAISNTTPGLNYVFSLAESKIMYANRNAMQFFGLNMAELQEQGGGVIANLVHATDVATTTEGLEHCAAASDGTVISWEMRLRNVMGEYVWMRNYASVFKRDEYGIATEIVGIILDVHREKETAEQLLLREKQLLEAQDQAKVGSFELDVETAGMEVTPQFKEIYEVTDFDLHTLIDRVHPGDKERINKNRDVAIRDNGIYDNEYRYTTAAGVEKIIWSRGVVMERGGRKKLVGTAMDVTSRHQMVQQLLESEDRYKQAQAISHIGNWTWDMETKELKWSDEVYRIYDLEPQSLKDSKELNKYNHPDDVDMVNNYMRDAVITQQPFDFNYRILTHNGNARTLHAKGEVAASDGRASVIYGTLQDITEQQLIEKQLKDYRDFIEKITDVTPSIIAAYNINTGQYSFVNEAIEKLLGYPAAKVMAEGVGFVAAIVHPDDVPYITERNAKALEEANELAPAGDEPITEFKYRMRNSSGAYRWFHTYGTIFERNAEGKVESVLNVSVDITEQEEAEQALFKKNLQLQQSNTSLADYAYVASHDLKEPLRKISTFSDRILTTQQATLNEDGRIYLNKIIDASRRMQSMISDLLTVSTIQGNKAFEKCSLQNVLTDTLYALDHKIEEGNAVVESDELPQATVVPAQFRQLFQNLVNNSLKFARAGVPVHINITHKYLSPKAAAHLKLTRADKYLQLEFADNGIGFDNQYASKIFTIFQRLHGKSEYDGTGIGLAVCKKIAENHDGIIWAEGNAGEGAKFTIVIPVIPV